MTQFPFERYETLAEPLTVYHPTGEEQHAQKIFQAIDKAGKHLAELLDQPMPELEVLLVAPQDWPLVPRDDEEETLHPQPYYTNAVSPPCIVIPTEPDEVFGEMTWEKFAFMLYHEVALAFLEHDPRPWPDESPLWADEWQLKFAALWLSHRIDAQQGLVNKDLREEFAEIFEPEPDGKTPDTIRSFDWYEDTDPEDYLGYEVLLEQFAADLLDRYEPAILPRFLDLYRTDRASLLSDEVTSMLATALGSGGEEWLENLVYF